MRRLWLSKGQYPEWGASPEWDAVLEAKQLLADCERYHCLPSELDGEDYHTLQLHRAIESAERQYLEAERESRQKRRR